MEILEKTGLDKAELVGVRLLCSEDFGVSNMTKMKSIGEDRAIALAESGWWESCTDREIVSVQLFTEELCTPFGRFQEAVEKVLGRPVWTHEFAFNYDGIVSEFLGEKQPPTLEEILDMIPEEKRLMVFSE